MNNNFALQSGPASLRVLAFMAAGAASLSCGGISIDADAAGGPDVGAEADDHPVVDRSDAGSGWGGGKPGSPCHADHECQTGVEDPSFCRAPGERDRPSGEAFPACTKTCDSDAECAAKHAGYICLLDSNASCTPYGADGSYVQGNVYCAPGCATAACKEGEACGGDGHCAPQPCQDDAGCSGNFRCGSESTCERRSCSADGDCHGACVKGLCYEQPGKCEPIGI